MNKASIDPLKHVNQAIVVRNSSPEGRIWASIASRIIRIDDSYSEAKGDDSTASRALLTYRFTNPGSIITIYNADRNMHIKVPKITVYIPPNHKEENLLYEGSDLLILLINAHNKNGKPTPSGRSNIGRTGIFTLRSKQADIKVRYKPAGTPASEAYL